MRRQALESWRNVQSLMAEGRRLLGKSGDDVEPSLLKIYVRDAGDLPMVEATLDEVLPAEVPRIYLQGDVCRRDLLTEMDGMARLD